MNSTVQQGGRHPRVKVAQIKEQTHTKQEYLVKRTECWLLGSVWDKEKFQSQVKATATRCSSAHFNTS